MPFSPLPYCVHSYGFAPVYVPMYLAWLPGWINPLSHYVYIWLLPCICSHVFDKINRFIKSLVTLFAFKWFLCVKIQNHSHSLTQHHCKQDQPFHNRDRILSWCSSVPDSVCVEISVVSTWSDAVLVVVDDDFLIFFLRCFAPFHLAIARVISLSQSSVKRSGPLIWTMMLAFSKSFFIDERNLVLISLTLLAPLSGQAFETGREMMTSAMNWSSGYKLPSSQRILIRRSRAHWVGVRGLRWCLPPSIPFWLLLPDFTSSGIMAFQDLRSYFSLCHSTRIFSFFLATFLRGEPFYTSGKVIGNDVDFFGAVLTQFGGIIRDQKWVKHTQGIKKR